MEVFTLDFFYLEKCSLCALVPPIEHLLIRENVTANRHSVTLRLYLAELCCVRCLLFCATLISFLNHLIITPVTEINGE